MPKRGYKSRPTCYQLEIHEVFGVVNSDGVAVSGDYGSEEVTTVKNSTGNYTITMRTPFTKAMIAAFFQPWTANLIPKTVSKSASAVNVTFISDSGAATDTKFDFHLVGHDDIVRRG